MLELYRSELKRFGKGAAIYAAANLAILAVLQQMLGLPNAPLSVHFIMLVFYALSGLGFALYQFGTYRKPGRWIWLLHRPVHRSRILLALALVALTLAILAVALPMFAVLASQDRYTRNVIDLRHYAGAAYLALSALSAWLAGGYIMLHRSRWAFVVLLLPVVTTMHLASAFTVAGLSVACNALLLFLLYTVFRPNRHAGNDTAATVGSAVPLQVCMYVALVWGGSMLFQAGQMIAGVHPRTGEHLAAGSHAEAVRTMPADAMRAALATSSDPRAAAWRASLARQYTPNGGLETHLHLIRQHAVRHAVTTMGFATMFDNDTIWTFSHDRMQYRGVNHHTRADQGWLGADAHGAPFDSQPLVLTTPHDGHYLVNAHDIYQRPGAGNGMRHLLHLDGDEQFSSAVSELDKKNLVLTNRRLVILDGTGAQVAQIALPMPAADLDRVNMARVAEGMLVMLTYGYRLPDGVAAAPQLVYLVDTANQVHEVARRELAHDFPLLFEHKAWWVSPALHALAALPDALIDKGIPSDVGASRFEPLTRERPAAAWIAAIVAALLTAAGAAWWQRRVSASPRARILWCAACLLLGLPALLSLMMLKPRELAAARAGQALPAEAMPA